MIPTGCPGGTVTIVHNSQDGDASSDVCVQHSATLSIELAYGPGGWSRPTIRPTPAATVVKWVEGAGGTAHGEIRVTGDENFVLTTATVDDLAPTIGWTLTVSVQ